ncbi:hypothetical protein PV10_00967 [Exophiala mesophila]|uniref:Calcineurin-like phosphoesterase domain-containing protein n=1 Tax=Exophiala mesophila TaxID=212818 RepID=A0A0D2AE64_EXOME|nr:uncharacterized protein PV10_00967 [Exophiala mesophila]KIV97188.1 hypothetical protein PV10_00967 [Exophiala mesophila]
MSPTTEYIRTRFLFLSDTHCSLPFEDDDPSEPFRTPLPAADVLIHSGDLTIRGSLVEHERALALIASIEADLKIVVPGNHDITLDHSYYREHYAQHTQKPKLSDSKLAEIKDLYTGKEAQAKGIVYLEEGINQFQLKNGAKLKVYASAWQPEFCNWAFGYPRSTDRFNPATDGSTGPENPVPDYDAADGIDIMITHGPPMGILDETIHGMNVGCEHLRRAVERCRPKIHAFGHIHEGHGALLKSWDVSDDNALTMTTPEKDQPEGRSIIVDATGVESPRSTLFINASIMTVNYEPHNAPWLVDVNLTRAEKREGE